MNDNERNGRGIEFITTRGATGRKDKYAAAAVGGVDRGNMLPVHTHRYWDQIVNK